MTTSVLIVHWNDLVSCPLPHLSSPLLTLQAIRKQARIRHGVRSALVLGSWQPADSTTAELQRLGYRLYHDPPADGDLGGVLPNGAGSPAQAVLVMSPERARRWRAALEDGGCLVEIWPAAAEPETDGAEERG